MTKKLNREYELYKMKKVYPLKYKDITIRGLLQMVKDRGLYVNNWEGLYYTGFKVGFLKHKTGRLPKNEKVRKQRKKLVLDVEAFEKWIAKLTVVVPFGYKRVGEFVKETGYTKRYIYIIIAFGAERGMPVDKFKVGTKVYYNEEQFRRALLEYRFGNK